MKPETPAPPISATKRDFQQEELRAKLRAIRDPVEALAVCESALADPSLPPEQEFWYADFSSNRARQLLRFEQAELYAIRCSNIADMLQSDLLKARAEIAMAIVFEFSNRLEEAWERLNNAQNILDRAPDFNGQFGLLACRCAVLNEQGKFKEAIEVGMECFRLASERGSKNNQCDAANKLSICLTASGVYEDAIRYALLDAALSNELGDHINAAGGFSNAGTNYLHLKKFVEAKRYFEEALVMIRMTSDVDFHIQILYNLVLVCGELGSTGEGEKYADEVLALAEKAQNNCLIQRAHRKKGYILIRDNRFEEALSHLLKSGEYDDEGTWGDEEEYTSLLSEAYAGLGENAKAYEFGKKAWALELEDARAQMAGQLTYREHLQKESAEKSQEILRLKERELANAASSLAAQTELLGNFRTDLRKIVLRPDRYEPEDIIKQVRVKLKELPCEMIDFAKFEAQFATVHPDFRARLETKYPELTPQEVKMCLLIHVNLHTPAIARLTCLSERTVDNHRFNIRKKLGLKTEENLAEALRKFV